MSRTRIKICGLTRIEDVNDAVALGVDALGFVFVESSPRCVKIDQAKHLIRHLGPFVQSVALFMNSSEQDIREVLQEIPLNLLQFHGDETAEFCERFKMPYIKAIPMGNIQAGMSLAGAKHAVDPLEHATQHPEARGFLLDSHALGEAGGSGGVFDWKKIPAGFDRPLILAGGLNIDNVKAAVQLIRPYAVDVSSGVEAGDGDQKSIQKGIQKGLKDKEKMAAFVRAVNEGCKSK